NQQTVFNTPLDRVELNINNNVDNLWIGKSPLIISVDFELLNSIFDDFNNNLTVTDTSYLFMIGVSYSFNNEVPKYKVFILDKMDRESELKLVFDFCNFLRTLTNYYLGENKKIPILYHWGHFERSTFNNVLEKLFSTTNS